jgi:ribosomal protein L37AE/L43A
MEDGFIQCPACNGEGIDLDGFACWKCKGCGQITSNNKPKESTDTNINVDEDSTS